MKLFFSVIIISAISLCHGCDHSVSRQSPITLNSETALKKEPASNLNSAIKFKILAPNDPIQFDPSITNILTEKTDAVLPGTFYVYIGFGEKSGFNKGIAFYHVAKHFSLKNIELKFDSPKKCYFIGPFVEPVMAVEMERIVTKIAEDNGWPHFVTIVHFNK